MMMNPKSLENLRGAIEFFDPQDLPDDLANVVIESPSHYRFFLPTQITFTFPNQAVPRDGRYWKTNLWMHNGKEISHQEAKEQGLNFRTLPRIMLVEIYANTSENGVDYRKIGYITTTDPKAVIAEITNSGNHE